LLGGHRRRGARARRRRGVAPQPTTAAPRLNFETGLLLSSRFMGSIHDAPVPVYFLYPWSVVTSLARSSTCQVWLFQAARSTGPDFRVRVLCRSRELGWVAFFFSRKTPKRAASGPARNVGLTSLLDMLGQLCGRPKSKRAGL
jgi:hypothetical protein